ncbi:MAG: site-2 protease family protein [Chloroflexi bacterium]|nr:site-2 protease family protein [Chloroflexota bacterium]
MPGSITVARVLGIDIRIHFSWFLIFVLILLSLADRVLPQLRPNWSDQKTYIVAVITAVLFFVSVLLHELAHALTARGFRMPVSSITLFLLGGVANLAKEPPSARAEFLMAAAGPLASLALGAVALGIAFLVDVRLGFDPALDPVGVVASYLGVINLTLAVFNMIPGFPLDGGRVLRSIVWAVRGDRSQATRIAARGGQLVAGLLLLVGVYRMVAWNDSFGGAWSALIAYFLYNAASGALQQDRMTSLLGDVRVSSLMVKDLHPVGASSTVGALVRDVVVPLNLAAVPVSEGERIVGLVTIAGLKGIPQERWDATLVRDVMTTVDAVPSVSPDDTLVVALERFSSSDLPVLAVLQRAMLVGLLQREALAGYLRMRESLYPRGLR